MRTLIGYLAVQTGELWISDTYHDRISEPGYDDPGTLNIPTPDEIASYPVYRETDAGVDRVVIELNSRPHENEAAPSGMGSSIIWAVDRRSKEPLEVAA